MRKVFSLPWCVDEEPKEIIMARKAIKGDSNAYTELYKIYKEYLYKIAYTYVKDEQKALDILQESVYKGMVNIENLKEPKNFESWVTRILINVAINYIKKESKVVCLEEDMPLVYQEKEMPFEDRMDLYNAIDGLKEKYKTVIILKYYNNMSIEEIANTMGIPINTVKSHLRRAKESLGNILEESL